LIHREQLNRRAVLVGKVGCLTLAVSCRSNNYTITVWKYWTVNHTLRC